MKRTKVNIHKFSESLTDNFRKETARHIRNSTTRDFFGNPTKYFSVFPCEELASLKVADDLFQPNFYAIDFLLSLEDKKPHTVIDYGCGLAVLVHYLNYLGFNTYGYDSWHQISKDTAESFLSRIQYLHHEDTAISKRLISHQEIISLKPDIMCVLGVPRLSGFIIPDSVEYLLIDSVCSLHEKAFEEFEIEKYWKCSATKPTRPAHWASLEPHHKVRPCSKNFERVRSYTQLEVFKRR